MTESTQRKRPTLAEAQAAGVGFGGGRYRLPFALQSPKPGAFAVVSRERNPETGEVVDREHVDEGWQQRSAELVCGKVKSRRPHLLAYLTPPMVYEFPDEWRTEDERERGDTVRFITQPGWQMNGEVSDDGDMAPMGAQNRPLLGVDFNVLCRCAIGVHHIDGSKLRSALLGNRRRIPVIDVAGVSRD